ncbi:hypothetical protein BJY00DRAFT_304693 [Aspergillus carlsbadensis]|nr:hypothetical protein BJY00DRAFT_304693 [Aspergillus carlsbadensis]
MFDVPVVSFQPVDGSFGLVGLPILVDPEDYEGIHIAATNLASDFERVSGHRPQILSEIPPEDSGIDGVILVGSLQKSPTIGNLVSTGQLDVQPVKGKWESCVTATLSLPWAKKCFVIAGSDKRGTVFGIYALSEQIGVSPWHWWADVPVKRHKTIYALPTTVYQGEPSVRYRGLFINDEAPALTSWVHEKIGRKFNFDFYKTIFELLLRLKGNFLWPAMWSGHPYPGSSFFADDPRNQQMADAYGIVLSTSHHEPMQRSTTEWRTRGDGEWEWASNRDNITTFFEEGIDRTKPNESFITLGMRGEGDEKMKAENPKEALQDVVTTQREIIRSAYGKADGERQLIALYKEVLEYYEGGLTIPDDVTLLFPDDNFGNIRRLPTREEQTRSGGAGLYYHLEYVGSPRGYKWINTNSCAKIYQQLRRAYDHGISEIWVLNVGDLKPLELPFTFAMQMAWNIDSCTPSSIPDFLQECCTREFSSEHADTIASLLLQHDRLLAIRRHEHLEADTLSILNYREADTVLSRWKELESSASHTFTHTPKEYKAAVYQLILHPIKASRIYTELRIAQAKNKLYGAQRRTSTNTWAKRVLSLFDDDFALSEQFHNNPWTGTKWNHVMRQPHYGYSTDTWHDPSRDLITGLCYIQPRQDSNPIMGQMGIAVEGHPGVRPGLINEETDRMQPSRGELVPGLTTPVLPPYCPSGTYFEVFSRGSKDFTWTATAGESWMQMSQVFGEVTSRTEVDPRVEVSIDWARVPVPYNRTVLIDIRSSEGDYEQVHVPVFNVLLPPDFHGFVESNGYVSIEPGSIPLGGELASYYEHHPHLGRIVNGAMGLQSHVQMVPADEEIPFLTYDFIVFKDRPTVTVHLYFTMTLDADPSVPLSYDLFLDGSRENSVRLLEESCSPGELPPGWSVAVMDGVWKRSHTFPMLSSGVHRVCFRPRAEGILLEKIVVDLGGVRDSYLGPPQSLYC